MSSQESHLRTDVLTGRQVIVAPGRNARPIHVAANQSSASRDDDPFLEGNEHSTPSESLALRLRGSHVDSTGWLLRVVPNRYPAVASEPSATLESSTNFPVNSAAGVHEVVVECPDGKTCLAEMSVPEVTRILLAWQQRFRRLKDQFSVVSIFRNEGYGAGASLPHCHSQILASNSFRSGSKPRREILGQLESTAQSSQFNSWLNSEIEQQNRVVRLSEEFAVVCPFASRFPWQIRSCPRSTNARKFDQLTISQLIEVAANLLDAVRTLSEIRESMSFNIILTLPTANQPEIVPWMIDVMPRPNRFAGFELMTDVDINTVAPEIAAQTYRESASTIATCAAEDVCPEGYEWREVSD